MKNQMMRCLLAALLVLVLAVSFVSCGKDPAGTTAPDTTAPDVTTPEVTEPEVTEPEVTEPEVTEPEVTLPEETLPSETEPAGTEPAETEPSETEPEETTGAEGDHRHKFTMTQTFPTCVTSGTKMYVCTCGEMYEVEGDEALGHAWRQIGTAVSGCSVAGHEAFECVSCGEQEKRPLPLIPHEYTLSASLFSAQEVRTGHGLELLACHMCGELLRVDAAHASGHSFAVQEDGSYLCGCGAKADAMPVEIGSMDFTSRTQGKNMYIANGVTVRDGKWVLSETGNQAFLYYSSNPELAQALTGFDAEGNTVTNLTISFELEYTGTYEKDLNFIHLLNADGWAGSIYFGTEDGKLALHNGEKGAKAVLEPGEVYLVKFILLPGAKGLRATVEGGTFAEPVTILDKTIARELADSTQFGLGRPAFACAGEEDYSILIDNMTVGSTVLIFDPAASGEIQYCEHTFEPKKLVDLDHPMDENWTRYVCSSCGCFYDMQSCDAHIFPAKAVSEIPSTCVTEGTATYACLLCGENIEETLPFADHAFTRSTQVIPAEAVYGGTGYELVGCRDCKEMKLIMANHESGHCFTKQEDGSYLCACGAKANGILTNAGSRDFADGLAAGGITFDGTIPVTDGKWVISNSWRQNFLYYDKNPALAQALNGFDENGEPIESFAVAFELTYSGAYNKDLNFINILGEKDFLAAVHFGTDGEGHLALYDGKVGAKAVLTAGQTYLVKFVLVPSSNVLKATVEGGDLTEAVTLYEKAVSQKLSTSKQIGLSRPAFACGADEDYTIFVDNMRFEVTTLSFDESSADESNLCVHNITAAEGGYRCLVCERSFAREACDVAGHLLTVAVSESEPSTCTKAGYEKHACYLCGEAVSIELSLAEHSLPLTPTFTKPSTCVSAGYNEYKCSGCDYTQTTPLPIPPHAYALSTGVVSAEKDPAGKGFELFVCECGRKELKKVEANHESGHFFENGVCACGAKLTKNPETVATQDFSTWAGNGISFNGGSAALVNGKFRISTLGRDHSYISKDGTDGNKILYDLLDGAYNGASFDSIELAFDISYTGTMPASIDNNGGLQTVFSWRDTKSNMLIDVCLKQDEGALVIYGLNGEAILASGETADDNVYRVTVTADLKNNVANVVLTGENMQPVLLTANHKPTTEISDLGTIFIARKAHAVDPSVGAIYMDNVTLSYVGETVDLSEVNTDGYCEHDFAKTPIVDDDHQEADKWYTYTCSKCGGTYSAQEAKHIVVGLLDYQDKTSIWNSNLRITQVKETMLVNGKFKSSTSDAQHFITATDNAHIVALLDGVDEDGSRISRITLSYDFSYTGKLAFSAADTGNNYAFANLMHNANGGNLAFAIELRADADGKAIVCERSNKEGKLVLDPNKDYTFRVHLDPATKRISGTVSSADMGETELFALTSEAAFTNFVQIAFSRSTYNATYNNNSYEIFLDNISIAYDKIS